MLFFLYGTELADTSLTKIVTAASLGNLGSAKPNCYHSEFGVSSSDDNIINPKSIMPLSCPFGDLFSIAMFGQMSVKDKVDCE